MAERWKSAACAAVLSFLAALGGVGCLVTGMGLEADLLTLTVGCALMAVVFSLCFRTKWAVMPLLPMGVAALLMGYWWYEGTLRYSVEGMLYTLSDLYDRGYGWGILQWSDRELLVLDATPALLLTALPVILTVAVTTAKGRFGWLGAVAASLPLAVCLLLKDTVPGQLWFAMLLFAVLMILFTGGVRSREEKQGNRLVLYLSVPLALAVALMLLVIVPKDSYNGQEGAQKLEDFVLQLLDQNELPEDLQGPQVVAGDQDKVVKLESVGRRHDRDTVIMTVSAQHTGTLYLRGCAYDVYDGTSWRSTPGWNSWSLYYGSGSSQLKKLTVETVDIHSVLYFTYAPFETEQRVVGGRMRNDEDLRSYTMHYRTPITYSESWDERDEEIGQEHLDEYLQLPDSTRERATNILRKKVGIPTQTINAGQVWRNARLIADWVSKRADYDLDTPAMPRSEDDFALWFLDKADTGYCTHFASATVVLLRAAGIPAQYVTGYVTEVRSGQRVKVTEENAHAWVEVFINGVGWVVLEPTPGFGESQGGESQPGQTTEPDETVMATDPFYTTAPTEATTVTTEPSVTTEPVQTAATTLLTQPTTGTDSTGQAGVGGSEPGNTENETVLRLLLWLVAGLLAVLMVLLQWRMRLLWQTFRLGRGGPNKQALTRWRLLSRMARLLRLDPPEEMFWLAQKARFSQHTVTADELAQMDRVLDRMRARLRKKHIGWQLVYTLVVALY